MFYTISFWLRVCAVALTWSVGRKAPPSERKKRTTGTHHDEAQYKLVRLHSRAAILLCSIQLLQHRRCYQRQSRIIHWEEAHRDFTKTICDQFLHEAEDVLTEADGRLVGLQSGDEAVSLSFQSLHTGTNYFLITRRSARPRLRAPFATTGRTNKRRSMHESFTNADLHLVFLHQIWSQRKDVNSVAEADMSM